MVGCSHVRLYIRFHLSAWLTQAAGTRDFYSPGNSGGDYISFKYI